MYINNSWDFKDCSFKEASMAGESTVSMGNIGKRIPMVDFPLSDDQLSPLMNSGHSEMEVSENGGTPGHPLFPAYAF